jgi:hypothetical protein
MITTLHDFDLLTSSHFVEGKERTWHLFQAGCLPRRGSLRLFDDDVREMMTNRRFSFQDWSVKDLKPLKDYGQLFIWNSRVNRLIGIDLIRVNPGKEPTISFSGDWVHVTETSPVCRWHPYPDLPHTMRGVHLPKDDEGLVPDGLNPEETLEWLEAQIQ